MLGIKQYFQFVSNNFLHNIYNLYYYWLKQTINIYSSKDYSELRYKSVVKDLLVYTQKEYVGLILLSIHVKTLPNIITINIYCT